MRVQSRCASVLAVAGMALPLLFTSAAMARPSAHVIVTRFNADGTASQVPGLPASQVAEAAAAGTVITWSNPFRASPGLSTVPVIDNNGNVAFYGQIQSPISGPPPEFAPIINSSNQNAVFYSPAASDYAFSSIEIVARDGSTTGTPQGGPTPSNPQNWVLNSTSNGNGINAGVGMSSSGAMLVTGQLNGQGAVANNNNAAFFTGAPGSLSQAAIRSGAAPGTAGASFNTNLNFSATSNAVNPSGQVAFSSALTGGDTVSGQNDSGLFVASPSGGSLVMRRGDAAPGTAGTLFGAMTTNPGSTRINASGQVVFTNSLSTSAGSTPATSSNDSTLYTNAGGSLTLVAREGAALGGSSSLATESYVAGGTPVSLSNQAFNNSGTVLYNARLNPSANITAGTNDEAIVAWQGGSVNPLYQTGATPVPGVAGATFSSFNFGNTQARLNNQDHVAFAASMNVNGTTVTADTSDGLWLADIDDPASAQLLVREGMVAPGTNGATFNGSFFGVIMNNADMIVFQAGVSDGRDGIFAWSEQWGLVDLVLDGDTHIMGEAYPVTGFNYSGTSNGNGGVQSLNDDGWLTFIATSTGNSAIVVMQIPAPATGALAFMGLAAAARRRRRA